MEELPELPEEFTEPILPCLYLLKNCSILLYAVQKPFWKKYCHLLLNMVCLVTYQIALTVYLRNVFRGELKLGELAYVVSIYVVSIQASPLLNPSSHALLFKHPGYLVLTSKLSNTQELPNFRYIFAPYFLGIQRQKTFAPTFYINTLHTKTCCILLTELNFLAILKATIVILKKKEIRAIVQQMGSMWRTEDLTEVQINKKNALLKRLKFCYAVFYWMNMIGSWQYILAPLLETLFCKFILQQECGLLLPFSCSFPFDPTGNWARYIGVYIFETYSMFRIVYFYLGTEFLMITLCSHLATEFSLLQEDLLNIKPGNLAPLKIVIDKHQKLISLAQQLDDVFNIVIFVNLTSASISICFFGLSAKVSHGALQMANNFIAVVSLILPLFNLCYYGERLRETSAGMADSMYNNLWYKGDIRYQKLLWFIMRRSQKPCCLTSMKYNPITLNTFTTVLSTTWSYFSLASTVYEGES